MTRRETSQSVSEIETSRYFGVISEAKVPGNNWDSHFLLPEKLALGVFDGVSQATKGGVGAEIASKTIAGVLGELKATMKEEEAIAIAKKAASEAQVAVLKYQEENDVSAWTTAAFGFVFRNPKDELRFACVNIGDSRIYSLDKGNLKYLTVDDRLLMGGRSFRDAITIMKRLDKVKMKSGLKSDEDRKLFEQRNAIVDYLGKPGLKSTARVMPINSTTKIAATTDGIHDNATFDEIEQTLKSKFPSQWIASHLVGIAKTTANGISERAKPDDMTAVIMSIPSIEKIVEVKHVVRDLRKRREPPPDLNKRVKAVVKDRGHDEGRRKILGAGLAVVGLAAFGGVSYLTLQDYTSKSKDSDWIDSSYGKFLPIYGQVSESEIPEGLDLFFRQMPLTAGMLKINPQELVRDSEIPQEVLEKLRRMGTRIVFGDVAISDKNLRGALMADKAFLAASYLGKERKLQEVINIDRQFANVESMIRSGISYIRQGVLKENFGPSLINLYAQEVGGRRNLLTLRIVDPRDFTAENIYDDFLDELYKSGGVKDPIDNK